MSLKEKRVIFHEKSKMILEEIGAENDLSKRHIDARYEDLQTRLKANFEDKRELQAEKERKTGEEQGQLDTLGQRETELRAQIRRLEEELAKTRTELAQVESRKTEFEAKIRAKQRQFVERETVLDAQFGELTRRKEAEETLKMKADKDAERIDTEAARFGRSLELLDAVITANEERISQNSDYFGKVAGVFGEEDAEAETEETDQANIFTNKRAFEKRVEELGFQAASLEEDISAKAGQIMEERAEVENLQIRINTNDANKKKFILEKKFAQANMCMKQSKLLSAQKQAKLEAIAVLESEVVSRKASLADLQGQLEELKEGASEMWLNVKKCALERLERGREVLGLFAGLFGSEVFAHLSGSNANKKLFDLETERAHVAAILAEMNTKRARLANEIKEEDESEFDGELLVKLVRTVAEYEGMSQDMARIQGQIGRSRANGSRDARVGEGKPRKTDCETRRDHRERGSLPEKNKKSDQKEPKLVAEIPEISECGSGRRVRVRCGPGSDR